MEVHWNRVAHLRLSEQDEGPVIKFVLTELDLEALAEGKPVRQRAGIILSDVAVEMELTTSKIEKKSS